MPIKPLTSCRHIGCPELVSNGYCDKHKRDTRNYDKYRGSATERGYNTRWQKSRIIFLRNNPLCVKCMSDGKLTTANVADHIKPHKGDYDLMWDVNNWQALCKQCHDTKTATEDGGFGRSISG